LKLVGLLGLEPRTKGL